jgi:hypothetical protein
MFIIMYVLCIYIFPWFFAPPRVLFLLLLLPLFSGRRWADGLFLGVFSWWVR